MSRQHIRAVVIFYCLACCCVLASRQTKPHSRHPPEQLVGINHITVQGRTLSVSIISLSPGAAYEAVLDLYNMQTQAGYQARKRTHARTHARARADSARARELFTDKETEILYNVT